METLYANLIAYRVNANELALEFGTFFPGEDNRQAATYEDFVLRIVMHPSVLPEMIRLLQQAQASHEQASKDSPAELEIARPEQ